MTSNSPAIEIRALKRLGEMRAAVELQKVYWGDDLESVVPAHMLLSLTNYGGHVLAAFDGDSMIGVLIGFLGTNIEESHRPAMANLLIASKRMVVLPQYRGQGIGYDLKLMQRRIAVQQGVRLVTWTFDPLLALNAHLNIRKLGAVCQKYYENYYGFDEHYATLGASDRLVADWWVTNRRVEGRVNGNHTDLSLEQYLAGNSTIINPATISDDGLLIPAVNSRQIMGSLALLEIPSDYTAIVKSNETLARLWRDHTRAQFSALLNSGYAITDFVRQDYEGRKRAFYVMSYNLGYDFSAN